MDQFLIQKQLQNLYTKIYSAHIGLIQLYRKDRAWHVTCSLRGATVLSMALASVHQLAAPYLVSIISPISAVSTCRHLRSAGQGDLVVSGQEQLASVHEAFQSLVR